MAGDIERYRGSNLPAPTSSSLDRVAVHASRWYTPVGIGLATIGVEHMVVGHIPIVNQVVGTADHLPLIGGLIGMGISGVVGYVGWKKIGKPIQNRAKEIVKNHGLE